MGSLTSCAKKIGKDFRGADKQAIFASARRFRADGLSPTDAALKAVQAQQQAVEQLMTGIEAAITELRSKPQQKTTKAQSQREQDAIKKEASAQDFVAAPDGSLEYGEITTGMAKAMKRQAGKIRLQRGVQNANGTGYGLLHIEANHGKQIRALGFKSIEAFVADVAKNFSQIWQTTGTQLLVTVNDGRKDVMYVRLEPSADGDFYRINSAFPVRQQDYEAKRDMKKLWDGSEPASTTTGKQPAFAAESPDDKSSQGGPNARGQRASSVAQTDQSSKLENDAGNVAMFSRSQEDAAEPDAEKVNALAALSENDDLFALPKSDKETVEGIVTDAQAGIAVKKSGSAAGRQIYTFTMPDGKTATMSVRTFNPYADETAPTIYGYTLKDGEMTNVVTQRPGVNPEDVPPTDDVWIDVSKLEPGTGGLQIYNIAATYAHNTGKLFIGDPAGLSDDAMRRRTEQMLSSALKFGTTAHLAPHPRQVAGDKSLGIPPLKWTYGDDLGNIRALIETSLANYSDVNPFTFEPSTGRFLDSQGDVANERAFRLFVKEGSGRTGGAGFATLQRNAVIQSLVREGSGKGSSAGSGAGVLAGLVEFARQSGLSTNKIFYSRSDSALSRALSEAGPLARIDGVVSAGDNGKDGQPDTRPEAAANIGVLGSSIAGYLRIPRAKVHALHPYDARVLPGDAALREIAESFGSRLQGFDLSPSLLKADRERFGFFTGVRTGGIVFVRAGLTDRPHIAVLGHELAHELATKKPALYRQFVDAIRPYIDQKKYRAEFLNSVVAKNAGNFDKQREEFIGEVLSDGFMDRNFWRALGGKNPNLLRKIGASVMDLVERALQAMGYKKRAAPYMTDYKKVMQIAGEVMAEFGAVPSKIAEFNKTASVQRFSKNSFPATIQQIDTLLPDGKQWLTIQENNANERYSLYNTEAEARAAADGAGSQGNTAASAAAEVRSEDQSSLDGLDVGVRRVIERRAVNSIKSRAEALKKQVSGDLRQKPERKGLCFKLAAEASAAGLGNMVIGEDIDSLGNRIWHAVIERDNAIYDPTYPQWFEPGVYESTGFSGSLTLNPKHVREFIKKTGGLAPDAKNQGLLNPKDGDTMFSRATLAGSIEGALNNAKGVKLPAGYLVGDFFNKSGKLNWWHRTIGTQYNLAQRSESFKQVYDSAQNFINDVSYYATQAADEAPNLLPKLDTLKDITKTPLSAADNKAIAAPIFEGTLVWARDEQGKPVKMEALEAQAKTMTAGQKAQALLRADAISETILKMWQGLPVAQYEKLVDSRYASQMLRAGIVWTPAELKSQFGLTDKQVGFYQEFRAAIDKSLTTLAVSDMVRYGGKDVEPIAGQVMESATVEDASATLRDYLLSLADGSERKDVLIDMANTMVEKSDRARALMEQGYAPLSRFGRHSLDVVDASGQRVYFGLFESKAEATKMARVLRMQFPDAQIAHGTTSEQAHKLFAGVSPETLELFGDMLGLESQGDDASSKAFQEYLKLARSSRSAMKRLIQRKGIAGFSEDPGRVLAGFVYSNARQTSSSLHMGKLAESVNDIPQGQGELKDAAVKLQDYIKNPQEEGQKIRGLMFAQYLAGSVASAMVNMTQPFTMTFPYLSQFGGVKKAAAQMGQAAADVMKKKTGDAALDKALKKAEELGIVSPQEVHQLMAQGNGAGGLRSGDGTKAGNAMAQAQNAISKLQLVWGKMFSAAEQFNRRVTFIAAYRTAVEQGIADPMAFAKKTIDETQGVYNKGCVDEETECLTVSGWKRHGDLVQGEMVYAVNGDGALVESELLDVHRYTDGGYEAMELRNSNGFSMVLTPEHKCLIQNYSSRDLKFQKPKLVRADTVKIGHHFVRTPLADAMDRTPVYSDDEVHLFAWVAAEGYLFAHRNVKEKRGVGLVQSQRHNPHYVAEIDALLARLGGHHNRKIARNGEMVCWQLRKPLWEKVHKALPGKIVTHALVESLTPFQMALFLETFAKGDGHFPEDGGCTITQKDTVNLGALQAMAVLSGQSSTVYERMGQHDFGALYVAKTSKRAHRAAMTTTPITLDMVWCPQTEHGTWIARRNGRTFITGNSKPTWARGAVGGTLFTFKQFSISYIELLHRMATQGGPEGKKAALLMLAVLFLMGGAGGLPFAEDLEDVIDGAMQRLGYNFSAKQKRNEFFAQLLGQDAAQFLDNGLSGLPGMPIDVSGRMGMGNLLPGTGLFVKKRDHTRDVTEFAGPAGDLVKRGFESLDLLASGEVGKAVLNITPVASRNLAKGLDMANTGMYRDMKGKKVIDTDGYDAFVKSIGFQPNDVARVQESTREIQKMVEQNKLRETEIADQWAQGVFEGDKVKVDEARQMVKTWNENNPAAPIRINMPQIIKRVRAMRMSKEDRILKTTPKEIRAAVRRELEPS